MNCPLCDQPTNDPQPYFVCASNVAKHGGDTIHRSVGFEHRCCYVCHKSMMRRGQIQIGCAATGLLTLAATIWAILLTPNWLTLQRMSIAFVIMAMSAIVVAWTLFTTPKKVGDARIERIANRAARNLDRSGKPHVYAIAKRPDFPVHGPDVPDDFVIVPPTN